jgi:hypothetical protein
VISQQIKKNLIFILFLFIFQKNPEKNQRAIKNTGKVENKK